MVFAIVTTDVGGDAFVLTTITNNILGIAIFYLWSILIENRKLFSKHQFQRTTNTTACPYMTLAPCDLKVLSKPHLRLQATISYCAHPTNISQNDDGNAFAQPKMPNIVMGNQVMYYNMT